jgi:hypothetical protein
MRILGIDVNTKGVRIPFTKYRIPIPIFVSGLISIFGVPTTATNRTEPTEDYTIPNGAFQRTSGYPYQTQNSCPQLSMQYFDKCFIETTRPFRPPDWFLETNPTTCKAQLSCRTIDRPHRSNDLIVLYNRKDRFSDKQTFCPHFTMQHLDNCSVHSKDSFLTTDPSLKAFQCQAKLSCKEPIHGLRMNEDQTQVRNDFTVLYRSH